MTLDQASPTTGTSKVQLAGAIGTCSEVRSVEFVTRSNRTFCLLYRSLLCYIGILMQTSTFLGHPALVKSRWLIGSLTFGVLSYWVLPKLLTLEKKKWMRLGYAGLNMMRIYKFSSSDISTQHKHASEYLRDALLSNGGIYVKFGQFLASLDIIVPDQYRITMTPLTRNCTKQPVENIKSIVQSEYDHKISDMFESFNDEPISSASIAQVHQAVLLTGRKVAVKVQHSGLATQINKDIKLMYKFLEWAKYFLPNFQYQWLAEEFDKNIKIQLDFRNEARNMERMRRLLVNCKIKHVRIPELRLLPTERVLVMEYIDAAHIDQKQRLQKEGVDMKKIGKIFSQLVVKMIHQEGFVHADMHSGNLMARRVGKNSELILLDHGLYQQLDPALLHSYNQFWLGLILNDATLYDPAGRELGTTDPQMLRCILSSKNTEQLEDKNRSLFDLNPNQDRSRILQHAAKSHDKIVSVLGQLRRDILLLLKVNQFARTIENLAQGRSMGVYRDIATECVDNLDISIFRKCKYYWRMFWAPIP